MNQVTTEQAVATYKATKKTTARKLGQLDISNTQLAGLRRLDGGNNYPQWVERL